MTSEKVDPADYVIDDEEVLVVTETDDENYFSGDVHGDAKYECDYLLSRHQEGGFETDLIDKLVNSAHVCDLAEGKTRANKDSVEYMRDVEEDACLSVNSKRNSHDCSQLNRHQLSGSDEGRSDSRNVRPRKHRQKSQVNGDIPEARLYERRTKPTLEQEIYVDEDVHADKAPRAQNVDRKFTAPSIEGKTSFNSSVEACLFSQPNDTSDLRLIVEGRPLYVSRVVLSLVSPVLKRLLASQARGDGVEFFLPDKKYDHMVHLLRCVYPNILAPVSEETVDIILQLADEFHVKRLIDQCEKFMVEDIEWKSPKPHPDKIVRYLNISDKYGLERLQKATFQMAAKTESDLLENVQEFWDLPAVTTTSVFIRRLKLLEQTYKTMRTKIKEVQNQCSLYHKGGRNGEEVCTRCNVSIGKHTLSEINQL